MRQKIVFYMVAAAITLALAGCKDNKDDIDRIDGRISNIDGQIKGIGGQLDDVGKAIDGINGWLDQPAPTFKVGTDAGNDAIIVRKDTAVALKMPDGFKEADYTAIEARIRNGQYSSSDVKVRSASQAWCVTVNKPTFTGGRYNNDASVVVSLPQDAERGETAMLEVSLIGNDGTSTTTKRALICGREDDGENDVWEISPESGQTVIRKTVKGMELKFCLLDEQGNPATVFKEGENFSFFFSVVNKSLEDLVFYPDFAHSNETGFCRVFTTKGLDQGCPFIFKGVDLIGLGAYTFEKGERYEFKQDWIEQRDRWEWIRGTYDKNACKSLPIGDYYTEFESVFEFYDKRAQSLYYGDIFKFKINFKVE